MQHVSFNISFLLLACVFVFGLIMGSFLNCWARRIVYGESIVRGRSHCTSCNHVLSPADLVPVVSWLALHGTCRYCGAHISARYPLTELVCAIAYTGIAIRYGASWETVELVCFASVLLLLSLVDLDTCTIPNACIIACIVIRVLYVGLMGAAGKVNIGEFAFFFLGSGIAVFVVMTLLVLLMSKVFGRPSMGGGDLKLLFVAGIYFGWQQCVLIVVISCVLGVLMAFVGARLTSEDANVRHGLLDSIPFGPSLALSCWLVMLFGSQMLAWYWGAF